jgi:putative membrane protein
MHPGTPSALLSALHLIGFGLACASGYARGRAMAKQDLPGVFQADNAYGIAALLILGTGLARAFGGFEKGTDWYLDNPLFWLKMGLYGLVASIECWPMVMLIRWRIQTGRGEAPDLRVLPKLKRVNDVELVFLALIPLVAAAMARRLVAWPG